MRIWEIEDNNAVPSNLVREQDFILRLRRLHRHGDSYTVLGVRLSAIDPSKGGRGPIEEAQERIKGFSDSAGGLYFQMSCGDLFLIWTDAAAPAQLADKVMHVALPLGASPEDTKTFTQLLHLPEDYPALRTQAYEYIESAKAALIAESDNATIQILQSEAVRGPLTAKSVDYITRLLYDIDFARYVKSQTVHERVALGTWRPLYEERFVGFDDLKRAHFPKIEINPTDHLFHELCHALDRHLLKELSETSAAILGKGRIGINMTLGTALESDFASFARDVPTQRRRDIVIELSCGDLFQDFAMSLHVLQLLSHEGFRVALDGVTPDMLIYVNLNMFNVDYIKLDVSHDKYGQLSELKTREALISVPRDKLIFYRCDNEAAHTLGLGIGVTKFQGWYMDNLP